MLQCILRSFHTVNVIWSETVEGRILNLSRLLTVLTEFQTNFFFWNRIKSFFTLFKCRAGKINLKFKCLFKPLQLYFWAHWNQTFKCQICRRRYWSMRRFLSFSVTCCVWGVLYVPLHSFRPLKRKEARGEMVEEEEEHTRTSAEWWGWVFGLRAGHRLQEMQHLWERSKTLIKKLQTRSGRRRRNSPSPPPPPSAFIDSSATKRKTRFSSRRRKQASLLSEWRILLHNHKVLVRFLLLTLCSFCVLGGKYDETPSAISLQYSAFRALYRYKVYVFISKDFRCLGRPLGNTEGLTLLPLGFSLVFQSLFLKPESRTLAHDCCNWPPCSGPVHYGM